MNYFAWVNRGLLSQNPQELLDDLLDQTKKQINDWPRSKKIPTEDVGKLKGLNPKHGESLVRIRLSFEG